uniref:Secreted protein n=1 Tax=Nelumbo nucifera TaxID=4432 RepID=A0A822ZUY2_NELNU|nr:TPA_asm: hypothetical protein HUJ06_018989 [Nelumbo nucifera]
MHLLSNLIFNRVLVIIYCLHVLSSSHLLPVVCYAETQNMFIDILSQCLASVNGWQPHKKRYAELQTEPFMVRAWHVMLFGFA